MNPRIDRRAVALLFVSGLLVLIGAGGLWLRRERFFEDMGWVGIGLVVAFALGFLPLLGLLRRRRHRGVILLWCRRFGDSTTAAGARNRWMWAVVSEACRSLAFPFTLRDESLRGSQAVGTSVETPTAIVLLLVGLPLWLILGLWIADRIPSVIPDVLVAAAMLGLLIALYVTIGRVSDWLTTSFATIRGAPGEIERKLRAAKLRAHAHTEMGVIYCTDKAWQLTVAAALDGVDLALVDCTETSENLSWEIAQARDRLGAQNVLLLAPLESGAFEDFARIDYDVSRGDEETAALSAAWGAFDYSDRRISLGPYGRELRDQIRTWIEERVPAGQKAAKEDAGAERSLSPQQACVDGDDDGREAHQHRPDGRTQYDPGPGQHAGRERDGDDVVAGGPP